MGWVSGLLLLWVGTIPHQVPCLVAVEIGSPHYSTFPAAALGLASAGVTATLYDFC